MTKQEEKDFIKKQIVSLLDIVDTIVEVDIRNPSHRLMLNLMKEIDDCDNVVYMTTKQLFGYKRIGKFNSLNVHKGHNVSKRNFGTASMCQFILWVYENTISFAKFKDMKTDWINKYFFDGGSGYDI